MLNMRQHDWQVNKLLYLSLWNTRYTDINTEYLFLKTAY